MKRKVDLRYVKDEEQRQAAFTKRKLSLMRKAMELGVLCNAQVGLVLFDDKGRLYQFSSNDMDQILEQYGQAVLEPHERYTPHDLLYGNVYANGFGVGPMAQAAALLRSNQAGAGPTGSPGESPSGGSEACQAMIGTQQLLGPLGLAVDTSRFPPVSPRSEQAYNTISGVFETMMATMQQQQFQQLQQQQMQAEASKPPKGAGRPKSAPAPLSSSMPPPASRKPSAVAPSPAGGEGEDLPGAPDGSEARPEAADEERAAVMETKEEPSVVQQDAEAAMSPTVGSPRPTDASDTAAEVPVTATSLGDPAEASPPAAATSTGQEVDDSTAAPMEVEGSEQPAAVAVAAAVEGNVSDRVMRSSGGGRAVSGHKRTRLRGSDGGDAGGA